MNVKSADQQLVDAVGSRTHGLCLRKRHEKTGTGLVRTLRPHRAAMHLCTRTPRGRVAVDAGFRLIDTLVGALIMLVLGICSLVGFVAYLQHRLLFSISFAKSIRRGQLVKTLGMRVVKNDAEAAVDSVAVETALLGARSRAGSVNNGAIRRGSSAGSLNSV